MYTYWASVFLLPTKVIDKITRICRNYLRSGTGEYKKAPYISWQQTYLPKSQGGIGIKDLAAWNKATIVKLTWAVAKKKEGDSDYKVAKGYKWKWETQRKVPWIKLIWARSNVPRNAFISWVLIQNRLPIKHRMSKFQPQTDTLCRKRIKQICFIVNSRQLMMALKHIKSPGALKQIISAIIKATIYCIWSAKNHRIFKKQQITVHQTAYLIKDQARSRILFLSKCSKKYSSHIDSILT
ncbi:hypothetical protein Cgig2_019115 [Carnegiea gigantea]|uniref:Reverse transcriptase zinc-binding domain-containing protein n=1 Tax=Carnegiea gigantea TaxID=171969 RepID=A0A9Q1JLT0_9CARY|nr:hypothetical protein Cgig2_019115 [Carnegiea gigantea]